MQKTGSISQPVPIDSVFLHLILQLYKVSPGIRLYGLFLILTYKPQHAFGKRRVFLRLLLLQILHRRRQHQLDTIQLVYFAGTGIVVDSHDVGVGIAMANFFDHTFTYDMVWQAGKRLDTNDILGTAVNQLHHLTGQEPSFTSLVTHGNDRFGISGQILNVCRRIKMLTLLKLLDCRTSQPVDQPDTRIGHQRRRFLGAKILCLEVQIIEAVGHKVDQIRYNGLSPFFFQKLGQVIVGSRQEFNQDFTNDTISPVVTQHCAVPV